MPTGYTAKIADGMEFEEFALNCARAFGACVTMRDDPDTPIPDEFEVSDHHTKKVAEAEARIKELQSMLKEEVDVRVEKEYAEEVESAQKRIEDRRGLEAKYTEMLTKVKAWIPPSQEHQGLKDFMIEQIRTSIGFDCFTASKEKIYKLSNEEWMAGEMKDALRMLDRNKEEHTKEVARVASRNDWVQKLRGSL